MILSVVVPVYRGENSLHELVNRIRRSVPPEFVALEILLIDDGSPDSSWTIIRELASAYPTVKGYKLSRNFGQHHAISAGIDHCKGDWVVVMDGDLQDRPEEITRLYEKSKEGFKMVLASRTNRKDNWLKRLQSAAFYWVFGYLTGFKFDKSIGNFGLYHKDCMAACRLMNESVRAFPQMMHWIGFRKTSLAVEHAARTEGKSNYTWDKLIRLSLDIALSYSDRPLRLIIQFGLSLSLISLCLLPVVYTQLPNNQLGYAFLLVSIFMLSGILLMAIGLCGLYIGRIFETVKKRPHYIIEESIC